MILIIISVIIIKGSLQLCAYGRGELAMI